MARHRVSNERSLPVGVALAVALAAVAAGAQESESLTVDVGECVNLPSREERLACYERRIDAARAESAPPADAPMRSVPAARAAPESDHDNGRGDRRSSSAGDRTQTQEVVGTITGLRETVPRSYLIALDNGQVWRQTTPENYPLREGQRVRIYAPKRRWGDSMRLTVENQNGFILVERVR